MGFFLRDGGLEGAVYNVLGASGGIVVGWKIMVTYLDAGWGAEGAIHCSLGRKGWIRLGRVGLG